MSRMPDDAHASKAAAEQAAVATPLAPEPHVGGLTYAQGAVLVLSLLVVAGHVFRVATAPANSWAEQVFFVQYALIPVLALDNPFALISHMFVHGGWLHLGLNIAFFIMLGLVVARRLGDGVAAAAAMLVLTLFSGLGGAALVILVNPESQDAVVGFSGAVCGVAAAYLLSRYEDWRQSLADRRVRISMFWSLAINVGAAWAATQSGWIAISWEAHLGGFIAGGLGWTVLAPKPREVRRSLQIGPWGR